MEIPTSNQWEGMESFDPGARPSGRDARKWLVRALDFLAVFAIALVLFRFFVAPRFFTPVGARALPIVLPMVGGGIFRLEDHRGRLVFLEFSASWCQACKAELPLVERYARAHPDVDVIVVDSGDPAPVAARFAREESLSAVAVDTDQRVQGAFDVFGFPTIVVIDPRGYIRSRWYGYNPAVESAMEHARTSLSGLPARSTLR